MLTQSRKSNNHVVYGLMLWLGGIALALLLAPNQSAAQANEAVSIDTSWIESTIVVSETLTQTNDIWLPLIINPLESDSLSGGFRTSVIPKAEDDFSSAEFSLWIPEDVAIVRGIIMYGPGCGASSLGNKPQKRRAEFAEKWDLAFLGMQFKDKSGGKFCGWSRAERSGSAEATLQALQNFAEGTSRPELVHTPWLTFGMSGGAGWAMDMAILYPERTIAAFPRGAGSNRGTVANAYQVPIMMSAGENDGFLTGMSKTFNEHRPQGALWALAVTPNEGHSLGKSWDMALPFFDAVLAQRLPPVSSTDEPIVLRPLDQSQAWLGHNATQRIASASNYGEDTSTTSWLPDEETARLWQSFVKTGFR